MKKFNKEWRSRMELLSKDQLIDMVQNILTNMVTHDEIKGIERDLHLAKEKLISAQKYIEQLRQSKFTIKEILQRFDNVIYVLQIINTVDTPDGIVIEVSHN